MPIPNVPKLLSSYHLSDLGDGRTRLELRFAKPRSARDQATAAPLLPIIDAMVADGMAKLRPIVEAAAREAEAAASVEPEVPTGQGPDVRGPASPGAGGAQA